MAAALILAIDQGTTNTKALLVDRSGAPVFRTSASLDLIMSGDGLVEQSTKEIWDSVCVVSKTALAHAHSVGSKIEAIAISNQRETAIAWDAETGAPLANAISWQCSRSAGICLRNAPQKDTFRRKTGLPLAPLVSAGKWAWLLENDAQVQRSSKGGRLRLGTVDAWLLHRMTSGAVFATDVTNASRTGLLNLAGLDWDPELLELFAIPKRTLPQPTQSAGGFGACKPIEGLVGVPILSMIGDSHAAMLGHGHFAAGSVKATYGTGSSIMALSPALPSDTPSLARTIAWSTREHTQFALEGNVPMTGSAIQWLGEFLHFNSPAAKVAELASTVRTADGLYFVPAMAGLGAPHWDASARGTVLGLERHHTSAHLARAAVDSIAYQVADVVFAVERASGKTCNELLVDGGATRNAALMQFQADILGRPVLRSSNEELSAIGAAWLAGLELGWWESFEELAAIAPKADLFEPRISDAERCRVYRGWQTAVESTRYASKAIQ